MFFIIFSISKYNFSKFYWFFEYKNSLVIISVLQNLFRTQYSIILINLDLLNFLSIITILTVHNSQPPILHSILIPFPFISIRNSESHCKFPIFSLLFLRTQIFIPRIIRFPFIPLHNRNHILSLQYNIREL